MGTILLGLFLLFTLVNLIYFFSFFSFATAAPKQSFPQKFPVSIIICAKNEAENLKNFLPAILDQDYPDFEVIVINDASADNTGEVIEEFRDSDPRVKMVDVQNNEAFWANKKYALTLGIKKAKNQHLLFTDADCVPQSKNWITEMSSNFQPNISIVLGYGGYFKNTGSLLNKLIRFETLLTAIQYFSYARLGSPYMGVGRNLSYTSKLFYDLKGFASHLHLRSGDDDLFVNEAATNSNTAICFSKDSITRSIPKKKFSEWFHQKKRHISVAGEYKPIHQALLSSFYLVRILFWILFTLLLLLQVYPEVVLGALAFKLIIEGIVYFKSARKLGETDVVWLFPFLDVFLIFMQLVIFISNLFSKPKHWK
ncbi:glycosyltransferase [Christiangramia salexigens]|uniref:Glycosyl transferase family 2 n=1 Tax=Christiangramia salexigens TaxID=1913577 RepID=A0A1L3J826_9FLAO|nr:glycosyltransferase [Christiangramia salexigens]APG61278.1 glycosyl transferase family 2 [Christiangramia salexigens]